MVEPKLKAASLDLRPLYYFVQVASLGSFSRAATALSADQPTISKFVKRLEADLETPLFHRNGRGITLTDSGEKLLGYGRTIFRNLSEVQTELAADRDIPTGIVIIALPPLLGDVLGVELVRKIRTEYPKVSLQLREGYTTDVVDWLGAGLVDIGVMFNAPSLTTLVTSKVLVDKLCLVGAPGSFGRIPETECPVRELQDFPMILPPPPHRLRSMIDQLANEAGVKFKIEAEVGGIATLLELVRARVGYTILPSTLLRGEVREGRLHRWPLVEPALNPILFSATSMQRPMTMASKLVLEAMTTLLKRARGSMPSNKPTSDDTSVSY